MPYYLKRFIALVFTVIVYLIFPRSASANYTFISNFDATLDGWQSISGHLLPSIESNFGRNFAYFTAPYGKRFPFLAHTYSDYISKAEFEFDYISGGASQGSGVMLSNIIPDSNQNPPNDTGNYSVGLWNISGYFYILSPLCDNLGGCGLSVNSRAVFKVPDNIWNKITFTYYEDGLEIILNDQSLLLPYGSTHKKPIGVILGNPVLATNNQSWLSFSVDNFLIKYGEYENFAVLPYYSQKDPAWKDEVYDNASSWAGEGLDTIERWGCAITAVAMVLDEYEVKMPTGEAAKPDKINTWLSSQPDGYVGNGLLNWLAISRLARQSRTAGHAPTDLEFVKSMGSPADELTAGLYPIIDEGGHFVTLYDQDTDNYLLNDPNDEDRDSKPKSEPILSVNTYEPSDTDLSYILIVTDGSVVTEPSFADNPVGQTYTEEIVDDLGGNSNTASKLHYIPTPNDGVYHLLFNNMASEVKNIQIYAYDIMGNVDVINQSIEPGESSWQLNYLDDGTDPSMAKEDTTAPTYIGTNTFTGWHNTPQLAVFNFEDENLPSDFVPPSCRIETEGVNKTCSLTTTVCDSLGNCAEHTLMSQGANIDLTPPPQTKHVWVIGLLPYSHMHWIPTKDTKMYRVEWGVKQNELTNTLITKVPFARISTPRTNKIYVRVISIDRAGNESPSTSWTAAAVWRGWWRFW